MYNNIVCYGSLCVLFIVKNVERRRWTMYTLFGPMKILIIIVQHGMIYINYIFKVNQVLIYVYQLNKFNLFNQIKGHFFILELKDYINSYPL